VEEGFNNGELSWRETTHGVALVDAGHKRVDGAIQLDPGIQSLGFGWAAYVMSWHIQFL
jgi:hypothetical protein